jgi:hypothetical protein
MMFAVLGYQLENDDVAAALAAARRHLRVGGLLLLDVWYGPAVLAQRPAVRTRELESPDGRILRTASGRLDVRRHICEVTIRLQRMRGRTLVSETTEVHSMRFFFPRELELFLKSAGFALRNMSPFPVLGGEPDESTWNVFLVAEAIAT